MIKIIIALIVILLTSCTPKQEIISPNDILLSIKNYECKMNITCFSNKNTTEYTALQTYNSLGTYYMEFLDQDNLKITFDRNILNISSEPMNISSTTQNYPEINANPLFLSYFINTYFNLETSKDLTVENNKISLTLPENNSYLYSATLYFENNLPASLTYFDKNGTAKVNIIYNEFKSL